MTGLDAAERERKRPLTEVNKIFITYIFYIIAYINYFILDMFIRVKGNLFLPSETGKRGPSYHVRSNITSILNYGY